MLKNSVSVSIFSKNDRKEQNLSLSVLKYWWKRAKYIPEAFDTGGLLRIANIDAFEQT
jgi:hypothetical protein